MQGFVFQMIFRIRELELEHTQFSVCGFLIFNNNFNIKGYGPDN